eukprot:TRINITY_DN5012_c5_g1_i1.p1 TRINITY_DN5012_c5_g1~~TRINITY_DN5012_c5_g1_i1.p1  ORF type:complete len:1039 (+),score=179.30 TRINITY_DN5012_c5_g1_i1:459-3119(+)
MPDMFPGPRVCHVNQPDEEALDAGFDCFRKSLHRLLRTRDVGGPGKLEAGWEAVAQHLESFGSDTEGRDIKKRITRLLQMSGPVRVSIGGFDPTEPKDTLPVPVPVACTCLDAVFRLCARYQPGLSVQLTRVRAALLKALFLQPIPLPPVVGGLETPTVSRPQQFSGRTWRQCLREESERATGRHKFLEFEITRSHKLAHVMDRVVGYWQHAFAGRIFLHWRQAVRWMKMDAEQEQQLQSTTERMTSELKTLRLRLAEAERKEKEVAERDSRRIDRLERDILSLRTRLDSAETQLRDRTQDVARLSLSLQDAEEALKTACRSSGLEIGGQSRRKSAEAAGLVDTALASVEGWAQGSNGCSGTKELLRKWLCSTEHAEPTDDDSAAAASIHHSLTSLSTRARGQADPLDAAPDLRRLTAYALARVVPAAVPENELSSFPTLSASSQAGLLVHWAQAAAVPPCVAMTIAPQSLSKSAAALRTLLVSVLLRAVDPPPPDPPAAAAPTHLSVKGGVLAEAQPLGGAAPQSAWRAKVADADAVRRRCRAAAKAVSMHVQRELLAAPALSERRESEASGLPRRKSVGKEFPPPPTECLQDVAKPAADLQKLAADVNEVVQANAAVLRAVYSYYCSRDQKQLNRTMSLPEFEQLLADSDVAVVAKAGSSLSHSQKGEGSRAIARSELQKLWARASQGGGPQSELSQAQFTAALMYTAVLRHDPVPLQAADALRVVLSENIANRAYFADATEFRTALLTDSVQSVFRTHKGSLKKIFSYYASGRGEAGHGAAAQALTFQEFRSFCDDAKIPDSICTFYALQQVFLKMQDEDNVGDISASYSEFLETVAAVAAFKNPAPYLPLHQKIRRFVEGGVLTPLAHKLKLRHSSDVASAE